MKPDKKIWNDFRKGEKYALTHMYFHNVKMLYRYGKKFTSDDEMVKDTIQDLFFDLIKNRDTLGETDNICFYLMASFRRRLARTMNRNNLMVYTADNELPVSIIYSAEQELINKEDLTQRELKVKEALEMLSPRQREILFYKYSCDFTYEQICEMMNLQYDSARKQVHRALKAIKEILYTSDLNVMFSDVPPPSLK